MLPKVQLGVSFSALKFGDLPSSPFAGCFSGGREQLPGILLCVSVAEDGTTGNQ
jgi:hypothetical protein